MPAASGIIEAVSVKPLSQEDQYGNKFRASFKIGDDWYSYGQIKSETINTKKDGSWHTLGKGDEVEFMYKQNGDFRNVQKSSLEVLKVGSGGSVPARSNGPSNSVPNGNGNKGSSGSSFVNPAEVGQCLNLSAEVLKLKKADLTDPDKVTEAILWYKEVRELFTELYPKVTLEEKPPFDDALPGDEPPEDDDEV